MLGGRVLASLLGAALAFCAAQSWGAGPLPQGTTAPVRPATHVPGPSSETKVGPETASARRGSDEPVHFESSRHHSAKQFDLAEATWSRRDLGRLRSQLEAVAKEAELAPDEVAELKLVRKDGTVLRNAFKLFDKRHESPEKLDWFITKFGKLNDALQAGDTGSAARYARVALDHLHEHAIAKEIGTFRPGSKRSFAEYMSASTSLLRADVEKESVLVPEFHEMRKVITRMLDIMTLAPELRNDPAMERLYRRALPLQEEMGVLHDRYIAQRLRGEIDYEHTAVVIPPEMKQRIRGVLASVE